MGQMVKTKTFGKESLPAGRTAKNTGRNKKSPSMFFLGAVLDLSWQMIVVVLVPIIVGNKLDNSLNVKPLFTILGLVIAVVGSVAVIRSAVKRADSAIAEANKREKHD